MDIISTELLVIIGTLLAVTYWYVKRKFTYWKRMGVQYAEPTIPFGNIKGIFRTIHISDMLSKEYNRMKGHGPFGGIYLLHMPIALILDTRLIKDILIKDFQYFMDRGIYYNEKGDPLSAHLFSLDASEWKDLRSKLTPTFTSGKMKYMFPTVIKVCNEFKEVLENNSASDELEMRDLLARYTTDVIGTCAFGIECNSLRDPNAEFRRISRQSLSPDAVQAFKLLFAGLASNFSKFIGLKVNANNVTEFFLKIVSDTISYRETNKVQRNDFMDLMIQLKNTKSDSSINYSDGLSLNQVAAQAFVFFVAGFETSSTLLTFTLYELALNKDIQSRARNEIDEVLLKYNGEFSYEAVMDMKYIDQILNESLRKYPPLPLLFRRTTKEYRIPDTNYTFPIDQRIWIPIRAIQLDPEYYPDPEKFDPDRFTPEAIQARDPMTFLPFGDGPRNCIGLRFGQMQTRIGLAMIIKHFEVSTSCRTPMPLKFNPANAVLTPLDGMWLNIKKLDKN